MRFEFATAGRLIFGAGVLNEIGALARQYGDRALVVTGRDQGRGGRLVSILAASEVVAVPFSVPGEPEIDHVLRGRALAKQEGCELVISLGGGSAIDAGKAIAAMLTNDGELNEYLEVIGARKALTRPSAPFLAVPTTAGTGAEVTRNAVLASPEHKVKVSLRSNYMLPRLALIDPELTLDLPPAITATTGLDALTQLIEPYLCSRPNPITDALCLDGMRLAARSIRVAFECGNNRSAREDMCTAALFGGLALANAGLGAVHGLAGPIGGRFPGAPHGAVCAALLPHVLRVNHSALRARQQGSPVLARYDAIARTLTGNDKAVAGDGIGWVRELVRDLQIPSLSAYGIRQSDAEELASKAAQASSMKANPLALERAELMDILLAAL
jgi:alcohol dehydrogenase class IV